MFHIFIPFLPRHQISLYISVVIFLRWMLWSPLGFRCRRMLSLSFPPDSHAQNAKRKKVRQPLSGTPSPSLALGVPSEHLRLYLWGVWPKELGVLCLLFSVPLAQDGSFLITQCIRYWFIFCWFCILHWRVQSLVVEYLIQISSFQFLL